MPRFVVLFHETPAGYSRPAHYDLMLEQGEMLRTWALERLPSPGESLNAERLPDHRPVYLDFEGAVAGDRGRVSRVEAGEYEIAEETTAGLTIRIRGAKLRGTMTVAPLADDPQRCCVSLTSDDADA